MCSLQEFDLFFDLPGEIREQILGYLLLKPGGIHINQDSYPAEFLPPLSRRLEALVSDPDVADEEDDFGPLWPVNYFLVSQTFHREAAAVYFRNNTFHILVKGTKLLFTNASPRPRSLRAPRSGDALLANPAWARARRRIRRAVLYVQRPRGHLEDAVCRPLLDMILAGGLKELEFRLGFKAHAESLLASGPMRCIYRVLTDPDLLSAKLSVTGADHGRAWGAFLEKGGNASSRYASLRRKAGGPGNAWLRVDVAALIRQYGEVEDQLRIVKVGD